ncbi:MAG TPA: NBR1-Ig-like domain-containing protein [Anaerolineales bacterium]
MPCLGDPTGRPFFMKSLRSRFRHGNEFTWPLVMVILILASVVASGCSAVSTPTPFRPPTMEAPLIEPTFIIQPTPTVSVVEAAPSPTAFPTPNPEECTNNLTFLEDLTIPDNMFASFGLALDKQWLVENSGTCHWNSAYRLRNIGGAALGAPEEIALYPARAGTQATLRILFTAPFAEGVYESAWQAIDANGNLFGDPVYIRIAVQ